MKKITLILSFTLFASVSALAQNTFFNDSLRMHMKQYLVNKDIASHPELYDAGNLNIFNCISMENIDTNPKAGNYKYGIYSFWGNTFPIFSEILIRRGNEYEILEILGEKSFMEIMIELIAYFHRYPKVPKELFPLYVDAVSRVYILNSHWEGAFNVKKKRGINEYGEYTKKETIYRIIEDSDGEIEFIID